MYLFPFTGVKLRVDIGGAWGYYLSGMRVVKSRPGASSPVFRLVGLVLVLILAMGFSACSGRKEAIAVAREQLFSLSYGKAEDQVDLFQSSTSKTPLKTRFAMREGIFYVSNGPGARVTRFSSFGDVLSMVYNPEQNPEPLLLKAQSDKGAAGRRAIQYPFRAVGAVAVDGRQNIFVEDRLPAERRVYDKDLDAVLDHVVLRFDKDGNSLDYLGQDGVGGTPFPFIESIYVTASDDCIVVAMTQTNWIVDWFDPKGFVRHSLRIRRDGLPQPQGEKALIANLDRIAPDSDGSRLVVKLDYYRESVDPSTKSDSGVEFAGSWAYHMDPSTGEISDRWEVPTIAAAPAGKDQGPSPVHIPELLGMADSRLFYISSGDGEKSVVSIYDVRTKATSRYSIDIAADELYYSTLYLSPEGILSALLGTRYEARVVWWRFDKIFAGSAKDGGK